MEKVEDLLKNFYGVLKSLDEYIKNGIMGIIF